jgi:hypothetical protein
MAWHHPGDEYEVDEYWEEVKERGKKGGKWGSKEGSSLDSRASGAGTGVRLVQKTRERVKRPAARQVLPGVPPRKQGMYKVGMPSPCYLWLAAGSDRSRPVVSLGAIMAVDSDMPSMQLPVEGACKCAVSMSPPAVAQGATLSRPTYPSPSSTHRQFTGGRELFSMSQLVSWHACHRVMCDLHGVTLPQVASVRSAHIYHNVRLDSRGQLVEALDLSSNCWLEMVVEWQE